MRLLKSAGYAVSAFASAEGFLRETPHQAGGCIVIDVHMPGMNGIELQATLLAQKRQLAVIMITAYEDVEIAKAAMDAGATAFLKKPFDDSALLQAIAQALGPGAIEAAE